MPADFAKAMALGADAVALSNSAIQSIGCVAARMCFSNKCPSGVATQDEVLRARLDPCKGAAQLANFFNNSVILMEVLARACGHSRLADFEFRDLTTWDQNMHSLTGIAYGGDSQASGKGGGGATESEVTELKDQVAKLAALVEKLAVSSAGGDACPPGKGCV